MRGRLTMSQVWPLQAYFCRPDGMPRHAARAFPGDILDNTMASLNCTTKAHRLPEI